MRDGRNLMAMNLKCVSSFLFFRGGGGNDSSKIKQVDKKQKQTLSTKPFKTKASQILTSIRITWGNLLKCRF